MACQIGINYTKETVDGGGAGSRTPDTADMSRML